MTRRERFLRTVERRDVDRPACWLGMPADTAIPPLLDHFGAADMRALKERLGDDVWPVDVPYRHPPANHIACAFDFARRDAGDYGQRTLTAPGYFAGVEDPERVASFPWPDPARHMTAAACAAAVGAAPRDYAVMGVLWSAHFQDACAAFGMESALMAMLETPDVFGAVIERIVAFYLRANRIFYEACAGRLDAVLIGNDLGSQSALMLSPELVRRFVLPGTRRLVDQAKAYGVKVVHHSCGAIRDIIPDLVAAGVDAIHPIQSLASGMEPKGLKRDFGDRLSFCGGVDTQRLLVTGSPGEVAAAVCELRALFPTGLVVSPSHEALLADVPPANVAALFGACRLAQTGKRRADG